MEDNKWRFPASGHGDRKGLTSGDTETFKKSPFQAFAREILQNSIDARNSDEEPTRVEFTQFEMKTSDIPGYDDLKNAIRRCAEFWQHKPDYVKVCKAMMDRLNEPVIGCLRVSDFNTTGLVGVNTEEQKKNKFLALAKGTGVSEKEGTVAGGSKGLGKNAAFLMSDVSTVFYATKANQDIDGNPGVFEGYIGVSDLISGYVDDVPGLNRDYTSGKGYFSDSELNSAIKKQLSLQTGFSRGEEDFGTDIFIIGFKDMEGWQKDVMTSVLDSFMAAIVRGHLEVAVNGVEINKNTIDALVHDENIVSKNIKANIVSQYRLLIGDPKVKVFDVETEYGNCELFILPYDKEEEELATHKCVMVRHPLMKIKDEPLGASFRVSAMCIIGEGELGEVLRQIENPQHIDWEPKRMPDKTGQREMAQLLNSIRDQIKQRVIECLQIGSDNPLDPNGAGDYLPDVDLGDNDGDAQGDRRPQETVLVSKPKANDTFEKNASRKSDDGNGLEPDIGSIEDSDGDVQYPGGDNGGSGGESHPGSDIGSKVEGDDTIFRRAKLAGVRYKVISVNKEEGRMRILFTAPIDHEGCYLNISMLDDANGAIAVDILSLSCNGEDITCSDSHEFGPFKITTNQKISLEVQTKSKGYFASEVKVICK